MSGGGGGGGSQNITSTVTQRTDPPEYVKPYATSLLSGGSQIASQKYQPYPGMQVAPLSPEQQAAMYMTGQRATYGSPLTQSAQNALQNVTSGSGMGYGMQLASNPLALQYASQASPQIGQYQVGQDPTASIGQNAAWQSDPLQGIGTNTAWRTNPLDSIGTNPVGRNPLLGLDNPYLNEAIQLAQRDMLPQYGYLARESGSYGNSGINQAIARTMGDISGQMRMQDYNLQAQLGESDLGRRNAAWENAANRAMEAWSQQQAGQSQGFENAAQRAMEAWGAQQAGQSQNFENAAQRAMNAWQLGQGMQQQAYESDAARRMASWESMRNAQQAAAESQRASQLGVWGDETGRVLQASQLAPTLAGQDYQDAQMLMGVGDAKRQYQQELIDNAMGQWDSAMNWPYSQYDWFANLMRGAGWGTYGTGSSTTTQPNPNASSGLANLIGGGLAGASLLSGLAGLF